MQEYIFGFLKQTLRVVLPALVFFLTGVGAVQRQARGFVLELKMEGIQDEIATLEARHYALQHEIASLRSRGRITSEAARLHGLRQPVGREIVILNVQPLREP